MNFEKEVKRAQKGHKDAFVQLITNCEVTMFRVAKSMLHSDVDCADAIQEAILKAYKSIHTLRETKYFKTWLIRILINECNKVLKSKQKVVPMSELIDRIQDTDMLNKIEVQEEVDRLEEELRILVVLHYMEDLSIKEMSKLLDLSEGTIKSRLSRARSKLAEVLTIQDGKGSIL